MLFSFHINKINACDYCGCGGALGAQQGMAFGNYVGFTSAWQHYELKDNGSGALGFGYFSNTLQGAYSPLKQLALNIQLPFVWGYVHGNLGREDIWGLGDMVVSANYRILDNRPLLKTTFSQILNVRGGIKFPTGKRMIVNKLENNESYGADLPIGTTSFDFPFSIAYALSKPKYGFYGISEIKLNTVGKNAIKFGNNYTIETGVFFPIATKKLIINPIASLSYDVKGKNIINDIERKFSGEHSILINPKLSITKQKWEYIISNQIPVYNKTPEQRVKRKPFVSMTLNYYI